MRRRLGHTQCIWSNPLGNFSPGKTYKASLASGACHVGFVWRAHTGGPRSARTDRRRPADVLPPEAPREDLSARPKGKYLLSYEVSRYSLLVVSGIRPPCISGSPPPLLIPVWVRVVWKGIRAWGRAIKVEWARSPHRQRRTEQFLQISTHY